MAEPYQFDIGKLKFRVKRLKVKASLRAMRLLGSGIIPALAEAASAPSGQIGAAAKHAVECLDELPELYDLFVGQAEYLPEGGKGWLALETFAEDEFVGRPDLVLEFVFECVKGEFGSFLSGEGRLPKAIQELIGKMSVKETDTPDTSPKQPVKSGQSGE